MKLFSSKATAAALSLVALTSCFSRPFTLQVKAADIVYPAALTQPVNGVPGRIVDVTKAPYNADKTGVTLATAALQKAINDNVGRFDGYGNVMPMTLYFPNGTYKIDNTLNWKNNADEWKCSLIVEGQSRTGVVLKLADNAVGFGDAANPKPMMITADRDNSLNGNDAFANFFRNFTIDIGKGNRGAIGLDWLASNDGSIRDITIRSTDVNRIGAVGLSMMRDIPGPCLAKNISVEGFDYGVRVQKGYYNVVFENLQLSKQKVAGFRTEGTAISMRKLTSTNTVPAVQNVGTTAHMVLLDSTLGGGATGVSAVQNTGTMMVRDCSATGYRSLLDNNGVVVSGLTQTEWHSHPTVKLNAAAPDNSLRLPVKETPEPAMPTDFTQWANVMDYGANPDAWVDSTTAIQAAMNSGKPVVYFPPTSRSGNTSYHIDKTITVPSSVRFILGMGTILRALYTPGPTLMDLSSAMLKVAPSTGTTLVVQGLNFGFGYGGLNNPSSMEIGGQGTVVLRDSGLMGVYNNLGAGDLFLENVVMNTLNLRYPQNVWARQFNPENHVQTKVINNGGKFWVLGLKTEYRSTTLATYSGGCSEILGGLFLATEPAPVHVPVILSDNSSTSASFAVGTTGDNRRYDNIIQEKNGGVTRDLLRADAPVRGEWNTHQSIVLYRSLTPTAAVTKSFALRDVGPNAAPSSAVPRDRLVQWLRSDGKMQVDDANNVMQWYDDSGQNAHAYSDSVVDAPTRPDFLNRRTDQPFVR